MHQHASRTGSPRIAPTDISLYHGAGAAGAPGNDRRTLGSALLAPTIAAVAMALVPSESCLAYIYSTQGRSLHGPPLERIEPVTGLPLGAWLVGEASLPVAPSPSGAPALGADRWSTRRCGRAGACATLSFRIVDATTDATENSMRDHASNADVTLYALEFSDGESARWRPVCGDGGYGVLVPGQWRSDGSHLSGGHTFSCTSGVIAKCVRSWGYKPWKTLTAGDAAVDLQPLHQACTRAARADYCGDGEAHTVDGTPIAIADIHGFNTQVGDPSFALEAGFDEAGAVWRLRERLSGARRPGARVDPRCGTARPWSHGAREPLLYVNSRPAGLTESGQGQ